MGGAVGREADASRTIKVCWASFDQIGGIREPMHSRWIFAVILGIVPAASASAQQSHLDTRRQIEQLAATFSERYNKQDAGAIASMFTKDAVRVTSGSSGPSIGPQAIEKTFKTQFESGFRHIDLVVDQVSPFGTDAAITVGTYQITGRGQGGPLKVDGRWTEVEVREGGVWKIRHSTVVPKIEPNPITPRMEANSVIPRIGGQFDHPSHGGRFGQPSHGG